MTYSIFIFSCFFAKEKINTILSHQQKKHHSLFDIHKGLKSSMIAFSERAITKIYSPSSLCSVNVHIIMLNKRSLLSDYTYIYKFVHLTRFRFFPRSKKDQLFFFVYLKLPKGDKKDKLSIFSRFDQQQFTIL